MKKSHVGLPVGEAVEEYLTKPYFDGDGVQVSSGIGLDGKEYPDPVPMAPPVGYTAPPDLMTMIRSMVRSEELRRLADQQGFETFEEADDFEIEDDPLDPLTPYEKVFEVPGPADEKKVLEVPGPGEKSGMVTKGTEEPKGGGETTTAPPEASVKKEESSTST